MTLRPQHTIGRNPEAKWVPMLRWGINNAEAGRLWLVPELKIPLASEADKRVLVLKESG
jgi:hypothetical protein